jgi:DNA-directed RNA polymerase specialized sigma24 family protein
MTAAERFAQASPRLLRLAYSELGDVGEAEDIVQEGVAAAGARGRGGDREPRRLADDGRRPGRRRRARSGRRFESRWRTAASASGPRNKAAELSAYRIEIRPL